MSLKLLCQRFTNTSLVHALWILLSFNTLALAADYDTDGIVDEADICPQFYDPGQEDSDEDGIGDACDTNGVGHELMNVAGVIADEWWRSDDPHVNAGFSGDGGKAKDAQVNWPRGLVFDSEGSLLFVDAWNNRIRKIAADGVITTFAGTGERSSTGDGGQAELATFSHPMDIGFDGEGNLYVVETGGHRVRKITPNGIISTIAGAGASYSGVGGFSGDGGLAIDALLNQPTHLLVEEDGSFYIADTMNQRIRKVSVDGVITTVAGNGVQGFSGDNGLAINAKLSRPKGLDIDSSGNLYIADGSASTFADGGPRLRKVSPEGIITTVAGGGQTYAYYESNGKPALESQLIGMADILVDKYGAIYFGDAQGVKRISGSGIISSWAGYPSDGYDGSFTPFIKHALNLVRDMSGNIYFSDSSNHLIRKVNISVPDDDGDFVANFRDNCIFVSNLNQTDSNNDGVGDVCDIDSDRIPDHEDNCPVEVNLDQLDTDSDSTGDVCDPTPFGPDSDEDSVFDLYDNCKNIPNLDQQDTDSDGTGDLCDTTPNGADEDLDGVLDEADNCKFISNPDQLDGNVNGIGDACDTDLDSDGLSNDQESDLGTNPLIVDTDNDGLSDVHEFNLGTDPLSDADKDGDGINDSIDNCILYYNPGQLDIDLDGHGDACDTDGQELYLFTIAGTGVEGYSGDGGPALSAQLSAPYDVAVDEQGNIYFSELGNLVVRKISAGGNISTIAGNGEYSGGLLEGKAKFASLTTPEGIALDADGSLYIAEAQKNRIRKVSSTGYISLFAGNGVAGSNGDNGLAIDAQLNRPSGLDFDSEGNLFIADGLSYKIRKINTDGIISSVVGSGIKGSEGDGGLASEAKLGWVKDVTVASNGELYISDYGNNRVRKVGLDENIYHVAGNSFFCCLDHGGVATEAQLRYPVKVAEDKHNNVLFSLRDNHAIRSVSSEGLLSVPIGHSFGKPSASISHANKVRLPSPKGIAVDSIGNIYIADSELNQIFKVIDKPLDSDGDYIADFRDNCPFDFDIDKSQIDTDSDGVGNLCDDDDDGDELSDEKELVLGTNPLLFDTDGDGLSDLQEVNLATDPLSDSDTDGDGFKDGLDSCVLFFNPNQLDSDGDGLGDACDTDGQEFIVATVAGNGSKGFGGDSGLAIHANLNTPSGLVLDKQGNLYISDTGNHRVRKVSLDGSIQTIAGTGSSISDEDNGAATASLLISPRGLVLDSEDNLYVADTGNYRIRKVSTDGMITTIAGTGETGYSGDGVLAKDSKLGFLHGLLLDNEGRLLIPEMNHHMVRQIEVDGVLTTIAGSIFSNELIEPKDVAIGEQNHLYVSDAFGVKTIHVDGQTQTLVSNYGGFDNIELDAVDNLYVSTLNKIKILQNSGDLKTIIGPQQENGGNVSLLGSSYMVFDAIGNMFVADSGNHRVLKVNLLLSDFDEDGIAFFTDNCIRVANTDQADSNVDGVGDACDADLDSVEDYLDNCKYIANTDQTDLDEDGSGDVCDAEPYGPSNDGDSIPDLVDNCPAVSNEDQIDTDNDGQGDACDATPVGSDADGDLISDDQDNCQFIRNPDQLDFDLDGMGDACDSDIDGDNVSNTEESNLGTNQYSSDTDGDGFKDKFEIQYGLDPLTDGDYDLDGIKDTQDICFTLSDPLQLDSDNDGIGDVCDTDEFEYWIDTIVYKNSPLSSLKSVVVDGDGIVYFADRYSHVVNKISLDGSITRVAGSASQPGFYGDDDEAINALLNEPVSLALDGLGNLFIADYGNERVRKISVEGIITTVAGNGFSATNADYLLDGEYVATDVDLGKVYALAADNEGNVYIANNLRNILKLDTQGKIIKVMGGLTQSPINYSGDGGPAIDARINIPSGMIVDNLGQLLIAEGGRIRTIDSYGIARTNSMFGSGLYKFKDISFDVSNNLLIQDEFVLLKYSQGKLEPIAGLKGRNGFNLSDGMRAKDANLSYASSVTADQFGNIYITELDRVRKLSLRPLYPIDSDNDYIADNNDNCPDVLNLEQANNDNDAQGDLCDSDDDNDGLSDIEEAELGTNPFSDDTDNDGLSDIDELQLGTNPLLDADLDGDGVNDGVDMCPLFYDHLQSDLDNDGIGDGCDVDDRDQRVLTYVGTGNVGFNGDGLLATDTELNDPSGITFDSSGNLYIADTGNHRIRKVSPDGLVTTIAGTGIPGFSGDGGPAVNALLRSPEDVAVDSLGNVFFSDKFNRRVRKISVDGVVSTIAGNGQITFSGGGDGGLAIEARLGLPQGIAIDNDGSILVVDSISNNVRKISPNGIISTIAGGGTLPQSSESILATDIKLNYPWGVDVSPDGNIFISELNNNCISQIGVNGFTVPIDNVSCRVSPGIIRKPTNLYIEPSGSVVFANNSRQILRLSSSGEITNIAGTDIEGYSDDGGLALDANFNGIQGVALGRNGALYISDAKNNRIRKVEQLIQDADLDLIANFNDNCALVANVDQLDTDDDGQGDACDDSPNGSGHNDDADSDDVIDSEDNCPNIANPDQLDTDGDNIGDLCDATPNGVDTDGDGVPDTSDNCPNIANSDQLDTDADSIGDQCDATPNGADTDGDGVPDTSDNCPNIANSDQLDTDSDSIGDQCDATPNGADTDGDGVPDTSDNCPNIANSDQLDTDSDSIGDLCDATPNGSATDSDGDGIPDEWEIQNGLNPFNSDDGLADMDGDGISNKDEYDMGTDISIDTVAPILTAPNDIEINSSGPFTIVDLGLATAEDYKDGTIVATVDNSGPFAPGRHTLTWTAIDKSGNEATAQQLVDVVPMASFSVSQTIDEGTSTTFKVMLNGFAVSYPVTIPIIVSGSAENPLDHDLFSSEIVIHSGTSSSVSVATAEDEIWEGIETINVDMGQPINAVIGSVASHVITIKEENIPPLVSIEIRQGGQLTTTVSKNGGTVELIANVVDPNPSDKHRYDWSITNNNLVPKEGYSSHTFSFDPSNLDAAVYFIGLSVIEEADGINTQSVTADTLVRVIASLPELSQVLDSDGDGISDANEGSADTDMDRIPDYLDAVDEPNQLPADNNGALVQVDAGMQLKLGETSFAAGNSMASISSQDLLDHGGTGGGSGTNVEDSDYQFNNGIFDFEVTGAEKGESIRVVLPQKKAIPANAVYRKYFSDIGWTDFVIDENNIISSAPGSLGLCPAPGDSSFNVGLTEGDFCVQLTIEDGGSNDTDGLANSIVKDPGGVAVQAIPEPVVSVANTHSNLTSFSSGDGEKVVLGFMFTSDSTDSEVSEITITASGNINEVEDVGVVRLYQDGNNNSQPESSERVNEGYFTFDDGEIIFTFPEAYQLPNGQSRFLVTYQF